MPLFSKSSAKKEKTAQDTRSGAIGVSSTPEFVQGQHSNDSGKEGFKSSVHKLLPRSRPPTRQPSPAASQSNLLVDLPPASTSGPVSSVNLLSSRPGGRLKPEKMESETKLAMLELGIQAMDLCQKVVAITDLALPNPLGDVLGKVTDVLGILKKMVENRQAWKDLYDTIDGHQQVFNKQLKRMGLENLVPDPESPLLAPTRDYADALEGIITKVLEESGLTIEGALHGPLWGRMKKFTSRFLSVESEKGVIQEYERKLSKAMEQFKLTLEIFTSFTVNSIQGAVDSIDAELQVLGDNVNEIRDRIILSEETRDTINTAHITPLGSQHKRCLDGTRVDVINEITSWACAKENKFPVYCIGDVAGTGKSTIARTLVEGWKELNLFAFFFSQEGSSTRTAGDFCFFLKEQIQFAGGSHLDGYWKTLPPNAVLQSETVEKQWMQLIQEPLRKLAIDRTYIIVVDALDECTLSTRGLLLECILRGCSSGHLPHLRVLITTRKEVDIRAVLDREEYSQLIQHKTLLNSANSTADVEFYVQHRLDQSGIFMSNIQERLRLISRCGGLFIFASLACKLLEDACSEGEPLADILHGFTSLDSLYHQALTRADRRPEYTRGPLKNILGIILTAQAPLSVVAIAGLLSTSLKSVVTLVERLGSILSVGGINEPIYILHATFAEFLLRQSWVTLNGGKVTNEYALSKAQSNRLMAQSCLSVLFKELKRNICNLEAHSKIEHSGINRQDMWQDIPAALRYATLTWISHTIPELHHRSILDSVRELLRNQLLCWLEVGGIGDKLADYMVAIRRLQLSMERIRNKLLKLIGEEDIQWCIDILAFLQIHHVSVHSLPGLVYSSALLTTPHANLVVRQYLPKYQASLPKVILWDSIRRSNSLPLLGHKAHLCRVAYSLDGRFIVSAAWGGEIAVWDPETAARLSKIELKGRQSDCCALTVLPGNEIIISVWDDGLLYRHSHETQNLICLPEKLDSPGVVTCVAWTNDWTKFAYATKDGQITLFSLSTPLQTGKSVIAHEKSITSLSFSPDGSILASTSEDVTYRLWNVTSDGLAEHDVLFHCKAVRYGTFSPTDGSVFTHVDGNIISFYNSVTDLTEWRGNDLEPRSVVYSPNGQQIAIIGSNSREITLWKPTVAAASMTRKLETGHTLWINCAAFSPDSRYLVTGGSDRTLRIHDLSEESNCNTSGVHHSEITLLAFSSDGKHLASFDDSNNLYVWDIEAGSPKEHTTITAGHRRGGSFTPDGSFVAHGETTDDIVFLPQNFNDQLPRRLSLGNLSTLYIGAIAFSPDGCKMAVSACEYSIWDKLVLLSTSDNQNLIQAFEMDINHDLEDRRLAYHPSGKYICFGEEAWEQTGSAGNILFPITGIEGKMIREETFPLLRFSRYGHAVLINTYKFCIPSSFEISSHSICDGLIALGGVDGRVMVLDFTHLATQEELTLLDRVRHMRREAAARSPSNRIQEVLSHHIDKLRVNVAPALL